MAEPLLAQSLYVGVLMVIDGVQALGFYLIFSLSLKTNDFSIPKK
jgi:hypothetical protein